MSSVVNTRRESFQEEMDLHLDSLVNMARWLTKRRSAAEELVLNTVTQAYRSWPKTDHATSPKVWLFGIQTRLYFDGCSTRQLLGLVSKQEAPHAASEKPERANHLTAQLSASELAALTVLPEVSVLGAIARLRSESRLLLLLRFREKCSHSDIAYITSLPEDGVKSRLTRLRRRTPRYILMQTDRAALLSKSKSNPETDRPVPS